MERVDVSSIAGNQQGYVLDTICAQCHGNRHVGRDDTSTWIVDTHPVQILYDEQFVYIRSQGVSILKHLPQQVDRPRLEQTIV